MLVNLLIWLFCYTECKVAFGLYDRDGDGYISTLDLGSALRSMGIFPTDNEIMDILNEVDGEGITTTVYIFIFKTHFK